MMLRFGYVWAGLMFATALANLAVAIALPKLWPAFIAVVPMASKIALFAVQYLTIRFFVKRQIMAEMAEARQAEPQAQAA
jgi:hypothetical protein